MAADRRLSKEWLEAYFTYGVDPIKRRVWLHGDVEESDISFVLKGLYLMDEESSKPIELFVSSFGGSVYEMFSVYDVIRLLRSPVHTVAIGKCMSAAPLLVAAGTKGDRYAMPNAWFMVHEGSAGVGSSRQAALEAEIAHNKKLNENWYSLMAIHTDKNKTWWRNKCKKISDSFFDAEEAVEIGLVDQIWLPNKSDPKK